MRSDNGTRDDEFDLEPRAAKTTRPRPLWPSDDETNPCTRSLLRYPQALSGGSRRQRHARPDAVKQTIMGLLGNAGSFASRRRR